MLFRHLLILMLVCSMTRAEDTTPTSTSPTAPTSTPPTAPTSLPIPKPDAAAPKDLPQSAKDLIAQLAGGDTTTYRPPVGTDVANVVAPPPSTSPEPWLDRSYHLPRLGANLIRATPLPRPLSADYKLQAGDLIRVITWGGVTVDSALPLDNAGNLAVPGVGAIPLAGLSTTDAQTRLTELLQSQFKRAGAVIAVENPSGPGVIVTGEVNLPGYLTVPPGGTVLEALSAGGGIRDSGTVRAIVVRSGDAQPVVIDLYRLALDGDASQLIPLPPRSSVHVPLAGPVVQVFGAVRRPASIELKPGDNLGEAIHLAGGVAAGADSDTIRLLREGPRGQEMLQVPNASLAQAPAQDGDRLVVSLRKPIQIAEASIAIVGAVCNPGTHAWREGLTVADAIAAAGGLVPGADLTQAVIERTLEKPHEVPLGGGVTGMAFKDLVTAVTETTKLKPLDSLTIPLAPALKDQMAVISVQGAVRKPGSLPFTPSMTLGDAIKLAGGVLPTAQLDQADIVRVVITSDGKRDVQRISVDLHPVLAGQPGESLANQDTIVVRTRADDRVTIQISGEVNNSGSLVLPRGTMLSQAITIAGGLTPDAFPQGATFSRQSEAAQAQKFIDDLAIRIGADLALSQQELGTVSSTDRATLQAKIANQTNALAQLKHASATGRMSGIDLTAILAGDKKADIELQAGDSVVVPAKPGTIRVLGEVLVPGSIRYEPGMQAPLAIKRSGGTTIQADEERIIVVRADGTVVAGAAFSSTYWDQKTRRWQRTDLKRLELAEGDTVIVPPDLRYQPPTLEVAKDWSTILFQTLTAAGTVVVLSTRH